MPFVSGFQSVTISVSNIDRSLAFYRDLLGFKVLDQSTREDGVIVHSLDIGNQKTLQLLSFSKSAKPSPWLPNDFQTGLRHAGFKVNDVDGTTARLKQAGVEFTLDPLDATGEVRIAFFKDPDGTLLEVVQKELQYHVEGPAMGELPPLTPAGDALIFDHVAITVSDLDKALTFYTARLGFPMIGQLLFKDERGFTITYLKAGTSVLELFSFSKPTQSNPWVPDPTVLGFKYISFSTENLDRQVANLKAADIRVLHEGQRGKSTLIEGPDGVGLEFMRY